jgi:hypothetical protein
MKKELKTIDFNFKEHFQTNSYVFGVVTVNYMMEDEKKFYIPRHYGDGENAKHRAIQALCGEYGIDWESYKPFTAYNLREKGIITRTNIQTRCLERELKNSQKAAESNSDFVNLTKSPFWQW